MICWGMKVEGFKGLEYESVIRPFSVFRMSTLLDIYPQRDWCQHTYRKRNVRPIILLPLYYIAFPSIQPCWPASLQVLTVPA